MLDGTAGVVLASSGAAGVSKFLPGDPRERLERLPRHGQVLAVGPLTLLMRSNNHDS
jgi:hypothetical protein